MNIGELLKAIIPADRIKDRLIDVVSYAADAGFYHLTPKAVVRPIAVDEVIALFRFSHQHQVPMTFRTGGTSLSGQSITDGILVDLSQYWDKAHVENGGLQIRVQPGIIGAAVNNKLKSFGKKIGPDPSSINSAMMGGILSNNSSGMCCGVHANSYHTTKYIKFVLPNGKCFSTENQSDYERFEKECNDIFETLTGLRSQIISNPDLFNIIRHKYQTKNTVGYSVNSFIDYEHPLDILAHLLIGGEGTLGFIAEAVMNTVDDYKEKSTALLYFPDIYEACKAIIPLTASGAEAVELMDRASLRSIEHIKGVPDILKTLPEAAAALLIEYQANTNDELNVKINQFLSLSEELSLLSPAVFTQVPGEQAFLWTLRKGMFPSVGAVRASGSTVILEDIAFPVETLGDAILDLQKLFKAYDYTNAIIFGHAKDGNIHFVVTQSFQSQQEIERYDRFLKDVVLLVVEKYRGTLKAEHGTGRNMAPFIATEWGTEIYAIMKRLKEVIDPKNLLNPGVIINDNTKAHITNLKDLPTVEHEVDKCMECGYCEHVCPSRNITLTPRRRIVVRRELTILKKKGEKAKYEELLDQYQYDGLDTCAVDGLCASACPVDINTGDLVKRLRRENHSDFANSVALQIAKNFAFASSATEFGVKAANGINGVLGGNALTKITKAVKEVIPAIPQWSNQIKSTGNITSKYKQQSVDAVVYMPTCISRMMGGAAIDGKKNIIDTIASISAKVGISFKIPDKIGSMCCGQMFSSKGYQKAFEYSVNRTVEQIWEESNKGQLPVMLDVSSCTHTLQGARNYLTEENKKRLDTLRIIDSIEYIDEFIIPRVSLQRKKQRIVLHPVCSLKKMGLNAKFKKVADFFAEEVVMPFNANCCGMAGDRGFLFPELTQSATEMEAREINTCGSFDGYYSSSKTCEMSLSDAVGKNYESIVYLVDDCI
ncbi:FAD linked oxidase domain protein [Pseudopedobacter saltans DSM 12145]|uniref:D-lactate dehydrogenase (cytochrome) n=1 Tax=Pseudopedobacter saltans (strain ATCC 51119 / DSM 12145 / JCM 21818 / CCUG 39354 / LMG 10337 / NBRC 100064 / NCIMB 13643) TaxID=762903 RepID=F0S8T1_PSESL|nr:FAD-binding and (Fe-S)-binding domain-containing protein [Pseudopedobacter saltans]ADY52412.1 FAD linked oxidase domain protein [Pseudopedobacter saltans DSM 12145]